MRSALNEAYLFAQILSVESFLPEEKPEASTFFMFHDELQKWCHYFFEIMVT